MSALPVSPTEIGLEARAFRDGFKTLLLASCSAEAIPVASYAPFAFGADGTFHVYVSELAAHTANLRGGRAVSVLFIEPEGEAAHLFARKRLTVTCDVVPLTRDSAGFDQALNGMRERFGDFIDHLKSLRDFHAFELRPRHATYVRGFAQAFDIPDANFAAVRLINERGHRNER